MELYDPPIAVTAEHDVGPHQPVNGYLGGNPPSCLEKRLPLRGTIIDAIDRLWRSGKDNTWANSQYPDIDLISIINIMNNSDHL
jgi:hypothetical protein